MKSKLVSLFLLFLALVFAVPCIAHADTYANFTAVSYILGEPGDDPPSHYIYQTATFTLENEQPPAEIGNFCGAPTVCYTLVYDNVDVHYTQTDETGTILESLDLVSGLIMYPDELFAGPSYHYFPVDWNNWYFTGDPTAPNFVAGTWDSPAYAGAYVTITLTETTTTPEPSTVVMFGTGLLGIAGMFRRYLLR
jgi:hypothetical protein